MNKIMEFKRLKDLREDHDLTTRELANKLEINHVQYWRYEKGQRDLPTYLLIKLADLYQTSTDYILERTDETTPYKNKKDK